MAAIRISQLAEVTSVTNDDVFVINDGDINTRKISYANLTAGLVPKVGSSSIAGDLTLSGTLTAGDLEIGGGLVSADVANNRIGVNTPTPEYTVDVNGDVQIRTGNLLRLNDPNDAFAVSFQTPVLTANSAYALPASYPSNNGLLLSSTTSGVMSWVEAFTDPMNTVGDMVFRDSSNFTSRLPIGGLGQVLTVQGDGTANWQNPVAGFIDPMTNAGDLIYRDGSNNTTRLGKGVAGAFLSVNNLATDLEWTTSTNADISVGSLFTIRGDGGSGDGRLKLNCAQNSHGVIIQAPPHSAAASYTLTLPDDDGTAGQVLSTDGSGALSWIAADGSSQASSFTWNATMLPDTNESYDLGSAEYKVRHLFLSDNSIKFESGDLGVTSGALTFQGEAMQVASLGAVLTTLGVQSFSDSGAALGAGLVLGDVYYDTARSRLSSVTDNGTYANP